MRDLNGGRLLAEWEKRGYCKSNGRGFDVNIDIDTLDYSDHVQADFSMFISYIGDKRNFSYEEFTNRDMATM